MKKNEKTFEEAMNELESITDRLSEGNLPLDEMMKLYEQGQELSKYCSKLLDSYDKKLEKAEVKNDE
ncbi:MAG: exodeoxyribonuclease VII small subunit [Clostridia bacterium]|nr:exodeoxyribonuclease VII small subunit [Clostridia bacterium]